VKVVVVGGGLGGLMAATLLGRRGHSVTLVERDAAAPPDAPEAVFEHWVRRGIPQAPQPHAFFGRSVRVLRHEAPDVLDDLLAAGALRVPVDLGDGEGDAMLCSRRLTYEAVVRRAAERQAGVTIRSGAGVKDLVLDHGDVPVVRGVHLEDGDVVTTDLVVDASGRRSPTPRILADHGLRALPEIAQDCGLAYISRHYRLHRGAEFPRTDVPIMADLGWAAALAFPGDRETFSLLAIVATADPFRRELATADGFSTFHRGIGVTAPWLHAGEPISEIRTMARVENRYRRLVDDAGPIVTGMILLGDAAIHTNPTAGRGVSLAFAHAQHLASAVDTTGSLSDFSIAFDEWSDLNLSPWYHLQASADAFFARRLDAAVREEELPRPERLEQVRPIMVALSKQDGPTALALRQVLHLVTLPTDVLGDPTVVAAADDLLAGPGQQSADSVRASRAAFVNGCEPHR
jgi:2-polyprenyl-6-methoxyphenol hydroxylase-like FAD-dependent oxidoreductase